MISRPPRRPKLSRVLTGAALVAGAAAALAFGFAVTPVLAQDAGEPTRVVEGFEGPANGVGIGFRAIDAMALNGRVDGLDDRIMRTRVWTVEPGGVVPVHTHRNRPAFVYVLAGSILEFRNTLDAPHRVNAGDLSAEGLGVVHYWRNDGSVPAILLAIDLFQDPNYTPAPMEDMPDDTLTSSESM